MNSQSISINALKKIIDNAGYFTTEIIGKSLVLYRDYNGRQVRTILKKNDTDKYEVETNYTYTNKISHYTFGKPEERGNRNKTSLHSIIKRLKKSNVLQHIDTSFLIINKDNRRLMGRKKRELEHELKELMRV